MQCEYFVTCDHEATGQVSNPAIGEVLCCQRCADRVGVELKPFAAQARVHVHLDDYHGYIDIEGRYASDISDQLVAIEAQGYDISGVECNGVAWEHLPYGARWFPPKKVGWQPCGFCGTTHPVNSEC